MMKKTTIALFLAVMAFGTTNAQEITHRCYTDEIHEHRMETDEFYRQAYELTQQSIADALEQVQTARAAEQQDTALYYIPTVVHIFHADAIGNLGMDQILDGMRVLNEDYRKMNSDTASVQAAHKPVHADTQIEFRLARLDPNGNCTDGVVYHRQPLVFNSFAPNCLKTFGWDNDKYMNIYLVPQLAGLLGYSAFPVNGMIGLEDGNFMLSCSFGSIGTASQCGAYDLGRTTTHEVGHYLNLRHTFQGGCADNDLVSDTPATSSSNFGCQQGQTTCGSLDMPENFMDYSDDDCLLMFTAGQANRIHTTALNSPTSQRGQLVTAANYAATGVLNTVTPCAPMPDYIVSRDQACTGTTITFTDNHYNGTATTRVWEFPGGTPSTSTDSIVNVTYAQPGSYSFELAVGNAMGTNTEQFDGVIVIQDNVGADASTWGTSFETASEIGDDVTTQGWELGDNFERVTTASQDGNASMRVNAYNKTNIMGYGYSDYHEEYLYLPTVDMTTQGASELRFWYAYTSQFGADTDTKLEIQVNFNCSNAWQTRLTLSGNNLRTASQSNTPFTPNSAQWDEAVVNLAGFSMRDNLRIRLKFTSGEDANNLYLDNFSLLDQTIGFDESGELILNAYPNPAHDHIVLENGILDLTDAVVRLTDMSGRTVMELPISKLSAGERFNMSLPSNISKGAYVLSVTSDLGTYTERWMID